MFPHLKECSCVSVLCLFHFSLFVFLPCSVIPPKKSNFKGRLWILVCDMAVVDISCYTRTCFVKKKRKTFSFSFLCFLHFFPFFPFVFHSSSNDWCVCRRVFIEKFFFGLTHFSETPHLETFGFKRRFSLLCQFSL